MSELKIIIIAVGLFRKTFLTFCCCLRLPAPGIADWRGLQKPKDPIRSL